MLCRLFVVLTSVFVLVASVTTTQASQTVVAHNDDPNHCDPLFIPFEVDEIGNAAVFPPGEQLSSDTLGQSNPVCFPHDDPNTPDLRVSIRNGTGRDLTDVWCVADTQTDISNWDGLAQGIAGGAIDLPFNEAFRLDHDVSDPGGTHHPLVAESVSFDGIWQFGEEWQFILQDYRNSLGLPAHALSSIGVGAESLVLPGALESSGSIIATPIPEPGGLSLIFLGLGLVVGSRRESAVIGQYYRDSCA